MCGQAFACGLGCVWGGIYSFYLPICPWLFSVTVSSPVEQMMRFFFVCFSVDEQVGKTPVCSLSILTLKMGRSGEWHLCASALDLWVLGVPLPSAGEQLVLGRCRVTFHHSHIRSAERKPKVYPAQNQGSSCGNTFLSPNVAQGGGRSMQKEKPLCQHVLAVVQGQGKSLKAEVGVFSECFLIMRPPLWLLGC